MVSITSGLMGKSSIDPKTIRIGRKQFEPTGSNNSELPERLAVVPGAQIAYELLGGLWRKEGVIYQIAIQDRKHSRFFSKAVRNRIDAIQKAVDASKDGNDVYLACSGYLNGESRTAANVKFVGGFWADVDCGEAKAASGKGYLTPEDAERALGEFRAQTGLPEPSYIIYSGGGIHAYWILSTALSPDAWLEAAKKLKALTKALNS